MKIVERLIIITTNYVRKIVHLMIGKRSELAKLKKGGGEVA